MEGQDEDDADDGEECGEEEGEEDDESVAPTELDGSCAVLESSACSLLTR